MAKISDKDYEILDFIYYQLEKKGFPPSVREICEAVGLTSTASIHARLKKLEVAGYIAKDASKNRSMRLVNYAPKGEKVVKVDFEDKTFLNHITGILKENKNSKKSVLEVSQICGDKLAEFKIKNYRFVESNHLNSKVLAESGDFTKAEDVSVATRNFDDYSYTLYIW